MLFVSQSVRVFLHFAYWGTQGRRFPKDFIVAAMFLKHISNRSKSIRGTRGVFHSVFNLFKHIGIRASQAF
ncbi:unnamed protein product [Agarophyton chilense]